MVSIIVAMDERGAIGKDNSLPWRLSSDLKRFKELTMGHHLIMGRKTFESIGKPLPGRQTIIVTRNPHYQAADCLVARSVEEAVEIARRRGESEVFICGGAEVFRRSLNIARRIYLTQVHARVDADVLFPDWDRNRWLESTSSFFNADDKNQYPATFKVLERIGPD